LERDRIFVVSRKGGSQEVVGALSSLPKFGVKTLIDEYLANGKGEFKRGLFGDDGARIRSYHPELMRDISPGDTIWAGEEMSVSQTKQTPAIVKLSLFQLVCWNGLVMDKAIFSAKLPAKFQGSDQEGAQKLVALASMLAERKFGDLILGMERVVHAPATVVPTARLWHAVESRLEKEEADVALGINVDQRARLMTESRDAKKNYDPKGPELDPAQTWWELLSRVTKYAHERAGEFESHLSTFGGTFLCDLYSNQPSVN